MSAYDYSSPGLDEDIVAEIGPARHEDGRPLYALRGESGATYYCEADDIEGVRQNISMYNPSSRYVPPPWWEHWVGGGVLLLIAAAIGIPLYVMGEQAFSAALLKLAKAVAVVTLLALGALALWIRKIFRG